MLMLEFERLCFNHGCAISLTKINLINFQEKSQINLFINLNISKFRTINFIEAKIHTKLSNSWRILDFIKMHANSDDENSEREKNTKQILKNNLMINGKRVECFQKCVVTINFVK